MGSFNGNIGTNNAFNLLVTYEISQSVVDNESYLTVTGYCRRTNASAHPYNSTSNATLQVGTSTVTLHPGYNINSNADFEIISDNFTVKHNDDGTKSVNISFSFNGLLSSWYPNGTVSQTVELPTIARASKPRLSDSSCLLGNTIRIYTDTASQNFEHRVWYNFTGSDGNVHYSTADEWDEGIEPIYGRLTNWADLTPTLENAEYINSNPAEVTCEICLATYTDKSCTTQIGDTQYTTFTLKVPNNEQTKPSITSWNISPIDGFGGKYIQNVSKVNSSVSVVGKYGATVQINTTANGKPITEPINASGNIEVKLIATDSRGFTTIDTKTIDVEEYSRPTLIAPSEYTQAEVFRCNFQGEKDVSGTSVYFAVKVNNSNIDDNLGGNNLGGIKYRYKEYGGTYNGYTNLSLTGGEYKGILNITFSASKGYVFDVLPFDSISSGQGTEFEIQPDNGTFELGEDGDNIGIGGNAVKRATPNVTFYWEMWYRDEHGNDSKGDYVIEQGTSGELNYTKWHSGKCELWGRITVVYENTYRLSGGEVFPFELVEVPCATCGAEVIDYASDFDRTTISKVNADETSVVASVLALDGGFQSANQREVSVHIIGKWK